MDVYRNYPRKVIDIAEIWGLSIKICIQIGEFGDE